MILNVLLLGVGVVMILSLIATVVWIVDEASKWGRGALVLAWVVGLALVMAVGAAVTAIIEQVAR